MGLHISTASRTPIYQQLAQQIREAIARGELQPETNLPSVRQLSRELVINPNTVARAYRQLQDDGVLDAVRGTGLTVAPAARRQCQIERTKLIRVRLRRVLEEATQSGLEPTEIEQIIRAELIAVRKQKP